MLGLRTLPVTDIKYRTTVARSFLHNLRISASKRNGSRKSNLESLPVHNLLDSYFADVGSTGGKSTSHQEVAQLVADHGPIAAIVRRRRVHLAIKTESGPARRAVPLSYVGHQPYGPN